MQFVKCHLKNQEHCVKSIGCYPIQPFKKLIFSILLLFFLALRGSISLSTLLNKSNIDDYPAVRDYLLKYGKKKLEQSGKPGARKKTSHKWFETQDPIAYWDEFSKQKIVWGNLNLRAAFTLAPQNIFLNAPATMIVPGDKFLLEILNSKLADYYIRNLGVTRNGGYFEYKPMFVSKMPVPNLRVEERDNIELLVMEILNQKTRDEDIKSIDKKLNFLICKLYSLSETEINFINKL